MSVQVANSTLCRTRDSAVHHEFSPIMHLTCCSALTRELPRCIDRLGEEDGVAASLHTAAHTTGNFVSHHKQKQTHDEVVANGRVCDHDILPHLPTNDLDITIAQILHDYLHATILSLNSPQGCGRKLGWRGLPAVGKSPLPVHINPSIALEFVVDAIFVTRARKPA